MAVRGENVGTAYVRILADGDGLDRSIRDQFKESEPEFDRAGRRASKRYSDAFAEEQSKAPNRNRLQGAISKTLAEGDYLQDFLKSKNWQDFRKGLGKEFGDAGRLAGDNLEKELVNGLDLGDLNIDSLRGKLAQAQKQLFNEEEKASRDHQEALNIDRLRTLNEAYAMNTAFNRRQKALLDEAYAMNRQNNLRIAKTERDRVEAMRKALQDEAIMVRDAYRQNAEFDRRRSASIKKLAEDFKALNLAAADTVEGAKDHVNRRTLLNDLRDLQTRTHLAGSGMREMDDQLRRIERSLVTAHPKISRLTGVIDRAGDGIGRAFGKGSRNNFINFIGSFIGGIAKAVGIIPRLIGKVFEFGSAISEALSAAAVKDGSSALSVAMAGVTAGLETGGAAFIAFAAAAVIGVAALGPIVSIMSLLLGIVTALAASITFGLIGAIAPLVGVLLPAAAAVGVLVAAFKGLSKAQKAALKVDFAPIVSGLRDIGNQARRGVLSNITEQAKGLRGVLDGFGPIAFRVGRAISHVADGWIEALNSTGFSLFKQTMGDFLPRAVAQLGRSLGNIFGGLGGVFTALVPITSEFLRWLQRITGEFAHWANSIKGQESLKRFFDRAGESAKSLGHFLKGAFDLLVELIDQGKGSGDSIFKSMGDAAERFTRYLEDHPDAVSKWFGNAQKLAGQIGNIVVQLGILAGKLETVGSDKTVIALFHGIGFAIEVAVKWVETVNGAFSDLVGAAGKVVGALGRINGLKIGGIKIPPPTVALPTLGKFKGLARLIVNTVGFIRLHAPTLPFPTIGRFKGLARLIVRTVGLAVLLTPRISLPSILKFKPLRGAIVRLVGLAILKTPIIGLTSISKFRVIKPGILKLVGQIILKTPIIALTAISKFSSIKPGIMRLVGQIVLHTPKIALPDIGAFYGLAGRIIAAVGRIVITPHISMPSIPIPTIHPHIGNPFSAVGGVFEGARGVGVPRIIGEAGAEAVVPLNRDLSLVDPSVRWLSAIAQGKIPAMANGGVVSPGKTTTFEKGAIQIITPNSDARAVASEFVNRLVATGY